MKKFTIFTMLISLMGCAKQSTQHSDASGNKILTSLKVNKLLAQTLTEHTGIQVELVVPATYSINAHARYFKKYNTILNESAKEAAACITIRAIWKHDDLYPYARRSNVRIVEIDGSSPVDKTQAGVKLIRNSVTGSISPYIWRSPANLTQMADFISKDLISLYPDQAFIIKNNLKSLKQLIFKIRTNYETKFAELESIEAISLTTDFDYLTSEFGIDILDYFLKDKMDWNKNDYEFLAQSIAENDVKIVICKRMPQNTLYETIINSGAQPVILTTLVNAQDTSLPPKNRLLNLYNSNLDAIYNGLKNN